MNFPKSFENFREHMNLINNDIKLTEEQLSKYALPRFEWHFEDESKILWERTSKNWRLMASRPKNEDRPMVELPTTDRILFHERIPEFIREFGNYIENLNKTAKKTLGIEE